jgi:hypothetical protein
MANANDIAAALAAMKAQDWKMGSAWNAAHELAQAHEGEPRFDRLHALCHRIEGDRANAAYWYRRAGVEPFTGSLDAEAETILGDQDAPGNRP